MLKKFGIDFSTVIFSSTLNTDEILRMLPFKIIQQRMKCWRNMLSLCIYIVTLVYLMDMYTGKEDIAPAVSSNVYLGQNSSPTCPFVTPSSNTSKGMP